MIWDGGTAAFRMEVCRWRWSKFLPCTEPPLLPSKLAIDSSSPLHCVCICVWCLLFALDAFGSFLSTTHSSMLWLWSHPPFHWWTQSNMHCTSTDAVALSMESISRWKASDGRRKRGGRRAWGTRSRTYEKPRDTRDGSASDSGTARTPNGLETIRRHQNGRQESMAVLQERLEARVQRFLSDPCTCDLRVLRECHPFAGVRTTTVGRDRWRT